MTLRWNQFQKGDWELICKGPQSRCKKLQADYRSRGYFTRVRSHNNKSYYTLEVTEAKEHNNRES